MEIILFCAVVKTEDIEREEQITRNNQGAAISRNGNKLYSGLPTMVTGGKMTFSSLMQKQSNRKWEHTHR